VGWLKHFAGQRHGCQWKAEHGHRDRGRNLFLVHVPRGLRLRLFVRYDDPDQLVQVSRNHLYIIESQALSFSCPSL